MQIEEYMFKHIVRLLLGASLLYFQRRNIYHTHTEYSAMQILTKTRERHYGKQTIFRGNIPDPPLQGKSREWSEIEG
jgi:hypothetical protein